MTILVTQDQKLGYRQGLEDAIKNLGAVFEQNPDSPNLDLIRPGMEIAGQVLRQLYPGPARAPLPDWLVEIERECGNP